MSAKESAKKRLVLGLPKGSLQEATIEKLAKAGYNIQVSSRSYVPYVDDEELEIRLIPAQEIDLRITQADGIALKAALAFDSSRPRFSRIATNSISGVMMPRRA